LREHPARRVASKQLGGYLQNFRSPKPNARVSAAAAAIATADVANAMPIGRLSILPLPRRRNCTDNIRNMNILLFGATGMVGQGVLRQCLLDPEVHLVESIGRNATGVQNSKLREIVHKDLWNYAAIESNLKNFDACFFCLGIGSAGMTEKDYEHVTYGITIAAAETLSRLNPKMVFVYVSGAATDSSEKGRMMWARVKGKTENALLRLPFADAYMFRPGFIEPSHGEISRTKLYRVLFRFAHPLLPLLRRAFPNQILTTEQIARAMLNLATHPYPRRILEISDIRAVAELS
jgi:uncharacterized protein YbjT (DUF2867 family)